MRNAAFAILVGGCAPRLYTSGDTAPPVMWVAPENGWPIATPPEGLSPEGFAPGQIVPDLRLHDQFGAEVSLWQFHGDVIALDISTMWCAPCQDLALGTEETSHEFAGEGFTYVTVLQEDVESEPPELDDLQLWASEFGISSPILADGDKATGAAVQQGLYPALLLVGRDLRVIQRVNPADDATLRAAVSAAL